MNKNRIVYARFRVAGLLFASLPAGAEDAISHPAKKPIGPTKNDMVASLAVINAKGASLQGNKLTLTGVAPNSIVFADRPVSAAGHVLTSHFIKEWDAGADSFAKNPPNATISVLSNDGASVADAVVTLKAPKMDGDNLTFEVAVLEGDLTNATGAAALFIDRFAVHFGGGAAMSWSAAIRPGTAPGMGVRVRLSLPASRLARWGRGDASLLLWTARPAAITPTRPATRLKRSFSRQANRRRQFRRRTYFLAENRCVYPATPHRPLQANPADCHLSVGHPCRCSHLGCDGDVHGFKNSNPQLGLIGPGTCQPSLRMRRRDHSSTDLNCFDEPGNLARTSE